MKTASAAEVQADFGAVLKDAAQAPVIVTRSGRPVALLLGVADKDELERLMMALSPDLRDILDASRRQIRDGKGIPHEEFWSAVENAPTRARQKKRRRKTA